jgi:hypothetical protein
MCWLSFLNHLLFTTRDNTTSAPLWHDRIITYTTSYIFTVYSINNLCADSWHTAFQIRICYINLRTFTTPKSFTCLYIMKTRK